MDLRLALVAQARVALARDDNGKIVLPLEGAMQCARDSFGPEDPRNDAIEGGGLGTRPGRGEAPSPQAGKGGEWKEGKGIGYTFEPYFPNFQ